MKEWFKRLHCCVIIYTPHERDTLKLLIDDVLQCTDDLLLVAGGDAHAGMEVPTHVAQLPASQSGQLSNKGAVLHQAFATAREKGYLYAITLEPGVKDLTAFFSELLTKLEQQPGTLLIGARTLAPGDERSRLSFEHRFSDFLMWSKSGIRLRDVQSPFRVYPIERMPELAVFSGLLPFEKEVIIRLAWQDIPVMNMAISVYHEPENNGNASVQSLRGIVGQGLYYTYWLLLSMLYYLPLRFFNSISRERVKAFIRKNFFDKHEPVHIKALSIAFGVFMGLSPIIGFQLLVGIPLAHLFKLNKAIFIAAANISIPPLIPLLVYFSYKLGALMVENPKQDLSLGQEVSMAALGENFLQYGIGAIIIAVTMGALTGAVSYLYFRTVRNRRLALESTGAEQS